MSTVRLAVDLMGGDDAPDMVIQGLNLFHQRKPKVRFLAFGDEARVGPLLARYPSLAQVCEFQHTPCVVTSHTKPRQALTKAFQDSSMRLALEAVQNGEADGAVSAGNTGAYLALSKILLGTVAGIDRPAIISQIPTQKGECVMLDLGGSLQASARNLVEFAFMGHVFAQKVLGQPAPSIGLLNVGREDIKGDETLQQASAALSQASLNFYGFVEGHDITRGTVSVVVTDGFTGNVALKTAEGVGEMILGALRQCLTSSAWAKAVGALARPFLRRLKDHFDPRLHNGALWLGLKGVAVKSHGGTDAIGFAHAVEMAYDMVLGQIVQEIAKAACHIPHIPRSDDAAVLVPPSPPDAVVSGTTHTIAIQSQQDLV